MNAVLVRVTGQQATGMSKTKLLSVAPPSGLDDGLQKNDLVIGATPDKGSGLWRVTLTAQVFNPKKSDACTLKTIKTWPKDKSWLLPHGIPSGGDLEKGKSELIPRGAVRACLTDFSKLTAAFDNLNPAALGFPLPGLPYDEMVVVLQKNKAPQVWCRDRYRDAVVSDPEDYRRVFCGFIGAGSAAEKGERLEVLLKELLRAMDPNATVIREGKSGDGGVDLWVQRSHELTGSQVYLVQSKNQAKPVDAPQVSQLRGAHPDRYFAKRVLVSVGGFTRDAIKQAKTEPRVELIGPDRVTELFWRHLPALTVTQQRFREWCEGGKGGAIPLGF